MTVNLSNMLFNSTLIIGTLITISAKSWMIMWIGLEMNLMSFIPMMNKNKTPYENEASMKYFMVQAMASMMLIMAVSISNIYEMSSWVTTVMILSSMFMKMGSAPFHMWLPTVMQGATWQNCIILMTWQKIAPMIMMGYQLKSGVMTNMIIMLNVIIGATGGLNQTSIRKMMAYSSISHLGWLILAMSMNYKTWLLYMTIYVLLNMAVISVLIKSKTFQLNQIFSMKTTPQHKFTLFTSMLSLAGMPPFMGFLPKWVIIQNAVNIENKYMILIMVMTTMLTLYFYLRMMYSAFTFNNQNMGWKTETKFKTTMLVSNTISIMGIPMVVYTSLY